MCVKVSSGKAYVKGYDVSLESSSVIDVQKPRDTQEVEAALVPYEMGTIFKVNNVFGVPAPNINDDAAFAELTNRRTASDTQKTGDLIGRARIYSFNVSNASYTGDSTEWDLRLFDIQIFTKILLNQNATNSQIPITSFIRGVSSGATGYVAITTSGANSIHLSDVTGQFIVGEQIIVNEDTTLVRSIESVKVYGIQDVKSVYQGTSALSGYASDFVADTVLKRVIPPNFSNSDIIQINNAGIATVAGRNFAGVSTDTIVVYNLPDESTQRFNRIVSIDPTGTFATLGTVNNVTGICIGDLPSAGKEANTSFSFGIPNIKVQDNKGLYAELENKNISDINLSSANLIVGKNITGESTDGSGVLTFDLQQVEYQVHFMNLLMQRDIPCIIPMVRLKI